jgi:uncharacterized membrane protein
MFKFENIKWVRMKRKYRIIRNHVVTGFIFLMPVLISIAVIGKFWNKMLQAGNKISKLIRIDTLLGPSGDAIIAAYPVFAALHNSRLPG